MATTTRNDNIGKTDSPLDDANILVRALRGEATERTPVWLMRQVLITWNHALPCISFRLTEITIFA